MKFLPDRNRLSNYLGAIASIHLFFPVILFVVGVISFAIGWPLSVWHLWIAALLTVISACALCKSWRIAVFVIGLSVLTHAVALKISTAFLDGSYDALVYHQQAVIRLAEGWNPLTEHSQDFGKLGTHGMLKEYFPKASWIAGAMIFVTQNRIEAGKLFQWTLMIAAACQVAVALLRLTQLRLVTVGLLSLVAAANPVAVYQSTTYLVDGLVANGLTILIAALATYMGTRERPALLQAFAAFVFLTNIKFTGLIYGLVIFIFFLVIFWFRFGFRVAARLSVISGAVVVVSVFLLGYAPYVRNIQEKRAIFYPIPILAMQEIPEYNMEYEQAKNAPANLVKRNRIFRFLMAHFSRTENVRGVNSCHYKFPLSVHWSEVGQFRDSAIRCGGFGPFFGGILLISSILAMLSIPIAFQRPFSSFWLIGLALTITVFLHSVGWWARYAPQAWLIPLLFATAGLMTSKWPLRLLSIITLTLALLNIVFVTTSYAYMQRIYTVQTRRSLEEMRAARQPVHVYLHPFLPISQRLHEAGIAFALSETLPPRNGHDPVLHKIPSYRAIYWWESESEHSVDKQTDPRFPEDGMQK